MTYTWQDESALHLDVYMPPKSYCTIDYHDNEDSPLLNVADDMPALARNDLFNLLMYFSTQSNIKLPKPKTNRQRALSSVRWWAPMKEIAGLCDNDVDRTQALVRKVITRMRDDGLTIFAPQSILAVAIDEAATTKGKVSVW